MSVIDYVQVGKRLRQVRGSQSQSVFAKKYNKRQAQISKIENGKEITLDWLYEISENEGVSLDYLVKGRTEDTTIQTSTKEDLPLKMSDSQVDYLRLYQSDTLPNIVLNALFSEEGSNIIGTLAYILNEWIRIYREDELEDNNSSLLDTITIPINKNLPIQHSYDNNKARLLLTYSESNIRGVIDTFLETLFDSYKNQNYKTTSVYYFNGCLDLIHNDSISIDDLLKLSISLSFVLYKGFHKQFDEIINKAISNDKEHFQYSINPYVSGIYDEYGEWIDLDYSAPEIQDTAKAYKNTTQELISVLEAMNTKEDYSEIVKKQITKLENYILWINNEVK